MPSHECPGGEALCHAAHLVVLGRCGRLSVRRTPSAAAKQVPPTAFQAGLGLTVFIGLKVEGHSQETSSRIEQALLAIPAIVACYLVSGTSDFLVEAAVPDLASYEQF
jgi:DNA-binding Lrp family transcriptional regulator